MVLFLIQLRVKTFRITLNLNVKKKNNYKEVSQSEMIIYWIIKHIYDQNYFGKLKLTCFLLFHGIMNKQNILEKLKLQM